MNTRLWKILVATALSIMALQLVWAELGFAQSGAKGYYARPCGFDMDDDGRIGEDGV